MTVHKLTLSLLTTAVMAFAGSAFAADLSTAPQAGPAAFAPAPQAISWTGLYVGGGGGYDWANFGISHHTFFGTSGTFGPSGSEDIDNPGVRLFGTEIDPSAWFATATAGYDWQVNSGLVLGVFGSYDFQSKDGTFNNPIAFVGNPSNTFEGQSWTAHLGNVGTVAARAGFLVTPKSLLYGLVGYSWGSASVGYFEGCTPNSCSNLAYSGSGTVGGVTLGAGWEWMMTHMLSTRIEYRYTNFGSLNASGSTVDFAGVDHANITDQSVRAVLTFRFGG